MPPPAPLISFYGDDFTGSTDALESLARSGLKTVLFTDPPTPQQLSKYPGLQAFGIAGMSRAMSPEQMEQTLRPVLTSLRDSGAGIVHYKVCSTFDSSPRIGSIGRVIDVAMDIFKQRFVPVIVGAPVLGRYCVFGNLFARSGANSEPFRLDRHPSMSKHPTTPMDEADLRIHLSKQTNRRIGLLDILAVSKSPREATEAMERVVASGAEIVLIDLLHENHLATVGSLLQAHAGKDEPLFVVGSSGIESALSAHWREIGQLPAASPFAVPTDQPIIAVCGSCSPVTAGQIEWATQNGFAEVEIDAGKINIAVATAQAIRTLQLDKCVVIHTGKGKAEKRIDDAKATAIGPALGEILRKFLESTKIQRVIVVGGDTSGQVARKLGIESLEMIAELTPGSPLCRATAPGSPADGIEMTFKGGQIGAPDFFGLVRDGSPRRHGEHGENQKNEPRINTDEHR